MASPPPEAPKSAADKIRAINAIDESVPKLLSAAASAISSLSSQPPAGDPNHPSDLSSASAPLESHRETFTAATTTYFTLVHRIEQDLKAQASLIAQALPKTESGGEKEDQGPSESRKAPPKEREEPSGLGSLDIGVLKSRLQGGELDVESKVWAEARAILEQGAGNGSKNGQ